MPADPALPEPLATARHTVSETGEGTTLRLESAATATTRRGLGAALDDFLRATAAYAALTDALLEAAVVRRQEPLVASRPAVEGLASCLSHAGFRVRFAPLRVPAPAADVWIGTGGSRGELEGFLRSHPLWKTP